jgi:hypothetical protein
MKTHTINIWISLFVFLLIISCHPKPKLYDANMMDGSEAAGQVNDDSEAPAMAGSHSGGHNVIVEEVLNTDRYSYLNVTENGEKFWIATPRMEVEIGETYHYTEGLLKQNFESKYRIYTPIPRNQVQLMPNMPGIREHHQMFL